MRGRGRADAWTRARGGWEGERACALERGGNRCNPSQRVAAACLRDRSGGHGGSSKRQHGRRQQERSAGGRDRRGQVWRLRGSSDDQRHQGRTGKVCDPCGQGLPWRVCTSSDARACACGGSDARTRACGSDARASTCGGDACSSEGNSRRAQRCQARRRGLRARDTTHDAGPAQEPVARHCAAHPVARGRRGHGWLRGDRAACGRRSVSVHALPWAPASPYRCFDGTVHPPHPTAYFAGAVHPPHPNRVL